MSEVPIWACWVEQKLVHREYGTMCLRALAIKLNEAGDREHLDPLTEVILKMYGLGRYIDISMLKCEVGGCEGRVRER